ncbi:MAG: ACT domain-containing protein [Victivallales bacterium]|nr:ACT domain-containing protein [Victivallales bacterium]MBR5026463.1 ACT domain-containing protein [Victivallales bacterium]
MSVKQLSVFLENRPGRLETVAQLLGDANISILALSVADTKDFGILRLLVDKTDLAGKVLCDNGILCQNSNVTAVEIGSAPGSLARVLALFKEANVNLEYMYTMAEPIGEHPIMIFRFDNHEAALAILAKNNIHVLSEDELPKA